MLILCGFVCSGKTTLGSLSAEKLHVPFYDTDQMMEQTTGLGHAQIWKELGEEQFRSLEREIVHSLKKGPGILALGGGTLLCEKNRIHLKELGRAIYLQAPIEVLYQRALRRGLPVYLDMQHPWAHFKEIAKARFTLYAAFAEVLVYGTEKEIVDTIVSIYGQQ